MILEPRNLSDLNQKLRGLNESKRKVIILTNRHPNEGTGLLARVHHCEWEKHGAVTIIIPKHWTPQGVWSLAERKKMEIEEVRKLMKRIPSDDEVIGFLQVKGFNVPVINFHGGVNRRPRIKVGTNEPTLSISITNDSRIRRDTPNANIQPALDNDGSRRLHQNEVLVEYHCYGSRQLSRARQYILHKGWIGSNKHMQVVFHSFDRPSEQLYFDYLSHEQIDDQSLAYFSRNLAKKFAGIVKHLSESMLS